ncbi:MAG: winged helix-turn-helix domain-containing protein [Nitrososphaerales archaeon]
MKSEPIRSPNWSEYATFDRLLELRMRSRRGRKIRPRNAILIAILEACRTPSVEHWIMIKARLGYETFWTHMNRLINEGKMICSSDEQKRGAQGRTYYSLTQEGLLFLEKLKKGPA